MEHTTVRMTNAQIDDIASFPNVLIFSPYKLREHLISDAACVRVHCLKI